jgi:hypothetical protein
MNQTIPNLLLSSQGLSDIADCCLLNNFEFIVDEKVYHCNRICAAFVSPEVARLLHSDPSVDSYSVDLYDAHGQFEQIMKLARGIPVPINQSNGGFLYNAALALGNRELLEAIANLGLYDNGLSVQNVTDQLIQKLFCEKPIEDELTFIAQHFSDIPREDSAKLNPALIEQILAHPQFQIESESWLFNWIVDHGPNYLPLLTFVRIEFIDGPSLRRFLDEVPVDYINAIVWEALCRRLVSGFSLDIGSTKTDIEETVDPLNGVFAGLNRQAKGSAARAGLIAASASTSRNNNPEFVTEHKPEGFWSTDAAPDSWIKFDFKRSDIKPIKYTIRTSTLGGNMRSWVLEGSTDDLNWTVIDEHTNSNELKKTMEAKMFTCKAMMHYRYLRIRSTGRNSAGFHQIIVSAVEFFGELRARPN